MKVLVKLIVFTYHYYKTVPTSITLHLREKKQFSLITVIYFLSVMFLLAQSQFLSASILCFTLFFLNFFF